MIIGIVTVRRIALAAAVALAITSFAFATWWYTRYEPARAAAETPIELSLDDAAQVTDLWFAPDGKLVSSEEPEPTTAPSLRSSRQFRIATYEPGNGRLARFRSRLISEGTFAVSRDGSEVAVTVTRIAGSPATNLVLREDAWSTTKSLRSTAMPDGWRFFGYSESGSLVILIHYDRIWVLNSDSDTQQQFFVLPLSQFYQMSAAGPYVLFWPVNSGPYLEIRLSDHTYRALKLPVGDVALAPSGRIAVRSSGGIFVTDRYSTNRMFGFRKYRPIADAQSIAFLDDDHIIVGTSRGLVPLPSAPQPMDPLLLAKASSVRLIAASPNAIAFVSREGKLTYVQRNLGAASYAESAYRNFRIALIAGVVFLLLAPVALTIRRVRAESELLAPEPPPAAPVTPPDALIAAIRSGKSVLFSGSQLASFAGLPDRRALLEECLGEAANQGIINSAALADYLRAADAGKYAFVFDELSATVPAAALEAIVRKAYGGSNSPGAVHKLLARLPFAGVIHAALDGVVPAAFRSRRPVLIPADGGGIVTLFRATHSGDFYLADLFGAISEGTVVLSTKQFRDVLARNDSLRPALQRIFTQSPLVFVGWTLEDLVNFAEVVEWAAVSSPQHHFALIEGPFGEIEARFLSRNYGIDVIAVGQDETEDFLKSVAAAVGEVKYQRRVAEAATTRLKAITLKNIGPFDDLSLTLNDDWNVFLGNNGRGKSIVLRSIVVALAGSSVETPIAARLLKSGRDEGMIVLKTDSDTYSVELKRDGSSVRVKPSVATAIEFGRWLVLGFPALRSVSWNRPAGPNDSENDSPAAADLLPLLSTDPDRRLDNLKQWLINLDYRAEKGDEKARKLFTRFFEILDGITPDVDLRFKAINPKTYEITLDTAGGIVPLEAVSQGTAAVLGWVGILLQRQHEVFADLPDPESRGALVLVDEIDAHMHPSWQQSIVRQLHDVFKNIQFVATTHSPLILTSLKSEHVFMFKARPGGLLVEKPDFDISGLRSDQLLTTPLFDLETARDPEVHKALMEYTRLTVRDDLNATELAELNKNAVILGMRLATPHERQEAREAFSLIETALNERIETMPEEKKRRMLDEVKAQLQDITSGRNRPS